MKNSLFPFLFFKARMMFFLFIALGRPLIGFSIETRAKETTMTLPLSRNQCSSSISSTSNTAFPLIKSYVEEKRSLSERDILSPYHKRIISLGGNAVPALLEAIQNPDRIYQRNRTGFIFMLGEIGDPRACSMLINLYISEKEEPAKKRIGISIGACMSGECAGDFVETIRKENLSIGWKILGIISGQDYGDDYKSWKKYFGLKDNLDKVNIRCRKMSTPQLG